MTPRERVLCALDHEEPDRVPVFFGTSGATSMLTPAYERLKASLGIQAPTRFISRTFQYSLMDEAVWRCFPSDGRPLLLGPSPSVLRREIAADRFVDEWGVPWHIDPATLYFETSDPPLRDATVDDLDRYPWPQVDAPTRFEGLAQQARQLQQRGFAVVSLTGVTLFEQAQLLRGMDTWLMDLAANPDFAHALLRKLTNLMKALLARLTDAAGQYIDVLLIGDDLGTQTAPMISPAMYRRLLKPYHAELVATVKARCRAKIFCHSDGNVYPLLGDLADVGMDIINPVQVSAKDMGDTARLKREFGARLSFCGGIDTQWALPCGTTEDVRAEVRRRIKDLAPGGGYLCSAVHCLQPDVPLENLRAMFDEIAIAGRYPIAL
jgi:uroporphyrinogen decarboxylase